MWARIRETLADWYILIFAICLIAGGMFAASHQAAAPTTTQQSTTQTPTAPSPANVATSQQSQRPPSATPPAPPQPSAQKTPTTPAGSPAASVPPPDNSAADKQTSPPASHDHGMQTMAANAPPPSSAGGPAPVAAVVPAATGGGDAAAGRLVYRKCQACHSMDAGKNLLGPSLAGIMGRKAGAESGYNYSPAMKQSGLVWDGNTLDAYLADPQKLVPGNKMPFPGLKTDHDRADIIAYLAAGAQPAPAAPNPAGQPASGATAQNTPAPASQPPQGASGADITYIPDARYTLRSGIAEGRMVYIGVGGTIDGKVNPVLTASEGQVVQVTLINGEGAEHDIVFPDQDAKSPRVTGKGSSTTIAFRATKSGDFIYLCSVPGHQLAGMQGQFLVTPRPTPQTVVEADISREATDLSPPIGKRDPQTVRVDLFRVEIEGRLAEGTTFGYWTFNGKVPGPFIRVRIGDTIDIHLKNSADSSMIHSVDFHATTGPGGGAAALQVDPGKEKSMTWKALVPGLYVYHCATPMVAEHIANGMYGLILVEPEGGLPPVDREFYVMQGEI
ncbi:MAG TPA: multicopper oxidase domain-containing protein, partial [Bradyrhizobium sp.]|nr:multicopper oxidase domain-containing protein [Bradyrhizobium sp.]